MSAPTEAARSSTYRRMKTDRKIKGLGRVLFVYNLLLPLLLVVGVIPWVLKMLKRGGFGTGLLERAGVYSEELDFEPAGVVYIHAVSVGEVLIANKLIRAWLDRYPEEKIVLAATTATGHAVAQQSLPKSVRIIYSPIDLPVVVRKVLKRFEPKQIILMESEIWPNLLNIARKQDIPTGVANARLSPRSERRYKKLRSIAAPLLAMFDKVAVTEKADLPRWESIGVDPSVLTLTGSIKFDQTGSIKPERRNEFQQMLDAFGAERPVVMALSTHAGEESLIAEAIQKIEGKSLPVIVPRHAERRKEVKAELEKLGYEVVLRSDFRKPQNPQDACLVVDSTGELRDWTAHASIAIIGKSFTGIGGQNPTEAIAAGVPVITGPNMQNFEPLISQLVELDAIVQLQDASRLPESISQLLGDQQQIETMCSKAVVVLDGHQGAAERSVRLLHYTA